MNIWHSGADSSPLTVNGVSRLIYTLALWQSQLGNNVSLLLSHAPDDAALRFSQTTGVQFLTAVPGANEFTPNANAPDVVHMHSVFIPKQWLLSRKLLGRGTPYLVTPHGGLSPHILARNVWKKRLYSALIEKNRFLRSSGITLVTGREEAEVRSFVPDFTGLMECIPNAVDAEQFSSTAWNPAAGVPRLVYLGRLDVQHKGIDILFNLADRLPELEFHLYGSGSPEHSPGLTALTNRKPPNLTFHPPVFGAEKAQVLAQATLYIQTSRWEAFGISIAEAMCVGLPCAIASSLHISTWFREHDLGLVLSDALENAAAEVSSALAHPEQLSIWSARARAFAYENFDPRTVALKYLAFYEQIAHR